MQCFYNIEHLYKLQAIQLLFNHSDNTCDAILHPLKFGAVAEY